jgi:hypothetical protein
MAADTSAANLRFYSCVSKWIVDYGEVLGATSILDVLWPGEQGLLPGLPS